MEEWKEYKLGDLYNVHNGLSKGGKFFGSGYPFLSFSTVFKNYFLPEELSNLVQSTEKEQANFDIKKGDVFITRTSESADELGMSSVALKDYPLATYNGFTKRLRPKGEVDISSKYIGYYLRSPKFRNNFYRLTSSMSTRASLSNADLLNMVISIPSLLTQQKIANILSSLDDKIEVNRRINEQLEELAQALFKSWFVDFEPFKDGEFVESELGMIPKGWKVGALEDLIEIKYGKDHKKLNDGGIPVYGSGGIMRYVDKSLFTGESVLIPRKGTLNNVMYVNRDFWTVDTMFFSKMKVPNIAIFVYLFLSKKDLASMNFGSAVPSMTVDILNRIQLVIPSDKVFEDYNNVVSSLFAQMSNNSKEILHLTTLRDTLLPKLMSGEMDVNERGIERT